MIASRPWIARLAMAGLTMTWIGCGGGVPDPDSDTAAADGSAPPVVNSAPPSTSPPPKAGAEGELLAKNDPAAPADVEKPGSRPAPAPEAPADDKPAATKGDSSGTSDLLGLGGGSAPQAEPPKEGGDSGSGGPGGPGGQSGAMRMPMGPGGGQSGSMPMVPGGQGGPPMAPGGQGGPPGSGSSGGADTAGGRGGRMMAPGGGGAMMPGGPGMGGSGGPGMGGDSNAPASYRDPIAGATTFLNAVRSRNKERIADATALRSSTEAKTDKMKKLFATILDLSVGDDTIDELAKTLEGYTIGGSNQATSTAKFGVILIKTNGQGGQLRRQLLMRKETKGWKVEDIGGAAEIEAFPRGRMPAKKR